MAMSIRLATLNRVFNAFGLMLVIVIPTPDEPKQWLEFRLMTRNNWFRSLAS